MSKYNAIEDDLLKFVREFFEIEELPKWSFKVTINFFFLSLIFWINDLFDKEHKFSFLSHRNVLGLEDISFRTGHLSAVDYRISSQRLQIAQRGEVRERFEENNNLLKSIRVGENMRSIQTAEFKISCDSTLYEYVDCWLNGPKGSWNKIDVVSEVYKRNHKYMYEIIDFHRTGKVGILQPIL